MEGRVIKFTNAIDSIDDFLLKTVPSRSPPEIYLTGNKIRKNSMSKDNFVFFQKEGIISHYTTLREDGPISNSDPNFPILIRVNPVIKMEKPIISYEKGIRGQSYNKIDEDMIKDLLIDEIMPSYIIDLVDDETWYYEYFIPILNENINSNNIWEFIPDSRVNYLRNEADLEELNDYENIMCSIEEIFRTL